LIAINRRLQEETLYYLKRIALVGDTPRKEAKPHTGGKLNESTGDERERSLDDDSERST
jgi:hypothetical protein